MRFAHQVLGVGFVAAFAMQGIGCGSEPKGEAPQADDSLLAGQTVYSSTGGWSATSNGPEVEHIETAGCWQYNYMHGKGTFTGPPGSTHKAGVCTLKMIGTGSTTFIRCNPALSGSNLNPTCGTPPAGGQNYCLDIYHDGNAYCFQRYGAASTWCAGSPALGGAAITMDASGTSVLYTPTWEEMNNPGAYYVNQACLDVSVCENSSSLVWVNGPACMGPPGGSSSSSGGSSSGQIP